ncbi:MAG: hypothetical protein U1E14_15555 [Geminicoccaceae bacterium]
MTFPYRIRSAWHVLPLLGWISAANAAAPPEVVVVEVDDSGEAEQLRLDRPTVPAGRVIFQLAVGGRADLELSVERTDAASFDPSEDIRALANGAVEMTLMPGDYVLVCNSSADGWSAVSEPLTVTL